MAQTTLLRGPAAGRAEGALWLLREFFGSAAPGGWVSSDGARDGGCAWAGEVCPAEGLVGLLLGHWGRGGVRPLPRCWAA